MNFSDNYCLLFVLLNNFEFNAINEYQIGLDPKIKFFIVTVAICGPLAISGLLFLLKKIEKQDPARIRWK